MKITRVSQPSVGPRGGLQIGSISITANDGTIVWIRFDSPDKWKDGQQKVFQTVVEILTLNLDTKEGN